MVENGVTNTAVLERLNGERGCVYRVAIQENRRKELGPIMGVSKQLVSVWLINIDIYMQHDMI